MSSTVLDNQSGGQPLVSGWPLQYSGINPLPIGEVVLRLSRTASGNAYIGFSLPMTATSGGMFLSGASVTDGIEMSPGDYLRVPRARTSPTSGQLNIYALCDPAASGQARLSWKLF